ncbi:MULTISPECIES: amphi-Trp domain-containing protein [unclassified Streptomyces]|uniref:amphi-Trp domain-containing protein n=1 Tax=unclassified Streptomyces TaxID=2593676 RepID=UPI002DDA8FFF|nr:amphi-Trp domain-containing protein [Streptomyces sp. NBC_01445]WSE03355.1 amphi-Trp domain-containing protein [Streptomyces sp. NBC_01445]
MKDLKFEQKRSLSRLEAADQLSALAAALREGGDAELELGSATLSLRVPDALRSEVEVEVGNGEIELEIEFKWPTAPTRTAPSRTAAGTEKATARKSVPAKPRRSTTGSAGRSKSGKQSATRTKKTS